MGKREFLSSLSSQLAGIPENEKSEILYDYEEHFRIGLESGKTEEEIEKALGDVRTIARQFKADYSIKNAEANVSVGNIFRAVFAIGILGLNLIFVLGPFLGITGVLIGLFCAAFGITVGGIGTVLIVILYPIFPSFINFGISWPFGLFTGIGLTAFGMLFFIGMCYLAKYFYKSTVRYLKWNLELIRK